MSTTRTLLPTTAATAALVLLGWVGPTPLPASASTAVVESATTTRTATLTRTHPDAAPTTRAGARGRVRLVPEPAAGRVCWRAHVEGMTTRGVHVLRRSTGEVATRLYDEAPTDADDLRGCATEQPRDLLRAYRDHPRRFVVVAFSYDGQDRLAGTLVRPRR